MRALVTGTWYKLDFEYDLARYSDNIEYEQQVRVLGWYDGQYKVDFDHVLMPDGRDILPELLPGEVDVLLERVLMYEGPEEVDRSYEPEGY